MHPVTGMKIGKTGSEIKIKNVDRNAELQLVIRFASDRLVVQHAGEIMLGTVKKVIILLNLHFNIDEPLVFGSDDDIHNRFFLSPKHSIRMGVEIFDLCNFLPDGKASTAFNKPRSAIRPVVPCVKIALNTMSLFGSSKRGSWDKVVVIAFTIPGSENFSLCM